MRTSNEEAIDPNFIIDAAAALEHPRFEFIHQGRTQPHRIRILRTLAKGGYGEVYVVRMNEKVYALKKVPKDLVLKNLNTTFFMNEKDVMTGPHSEWITKCYFCIQDSSFLYYIMEFIPGGDLMCYLSRIDVLSEDEIRFYAAEIFTAIHAMHQLGWIHRDLKPDNILIDQHGHVKLADFGSCIRMKDGLAESSITVGTPDYVSPDLLVTVGEKVQYGAEVDFWTMGVILYEMYHGTTPFYSDSLKETYSKINNIDYTFKDDISEPLKDLIANLLCEKSKRFGIRQVMAHRFFGGLDWPNLREMDPPYKPSIKEEGDTSNFIDTEFVPDNTKTVCGYKEFVGFTYDPEHADRIIGMVRNYNQTRKTPQQTVAGAAHEAAGCPRAVDNYTKLDDEHSRLHAQLAALGRDKEAKEAVIAQYNENLTSIIGQITAKTEEQANLLKSIADSKLELGTLREDVAKKLTLSKASDNSLLQSLREAVSDIQTKLARANFREKLDSIKKAACFLHKQNSHFASELQLRRADSDVESRTLEELKKQLRVKRTEVREYQQKIEQEIAVRKQLEDQLVSLKQQLRTSPKPERTMRFTVTNAMTNHEMALSLCDDAFVIKNFPSECMSKNTSCTIKGDEMSCPLAHIFIRELKNNELHHLSYKKRVLCLRIFLLSDLTPSSNSGSRRSLKALEADYEKETKILAGLQSLIKVLDGVTLKDALAQKEGSERMLSQLREEIERAKKSTITEYEVDDDENVAEFNNHLFYEKTVAKGTLCDYCNEVLYGVYKQAYCCRDCLLVVHKACYVLGDVSCEMNRAMKAGSSMAVLCKALEDKDKLLKLNRLQ